MTPPGNQRDLAVNYLLGYMPEEQRDAIADRLFSDDQFSDILEEAERDLLDAYARGELTSRDRAAVKSRLLVSERQLEKLDLAQALAARPSGRPKTRRIGTFLAWAAAVIVIVGATGTWLNRYGDLHKPTQSSTSQPVTKPLAQETPIFIALLAPGANRDADIQQFTLPQRAGTVRLDLQLPGPKVSATYSVRLVRQRETVYQMPDLLPHLDAGLQLLSVTVPASVLPAGQYRLYITPVDLSLEPATYNFQVR